jgi:hypothetical protein
MSEIPQGGRGPVYSYEKYGSQRLEDIYTLTYLGKGLE